MTDININDMVVKSGESVPRITNVNADKKCVRLFNVSNNKKTGLNFKVDWTFDFSNCSIDEIYELAARSAVIAYRKHFRNVSKEAITNFATKTIDVHKEIMVSQRKTLSDADKLAQLLDKISPEEREAILKEHLAKAK